MGTKTLLNGVNEVLKRYGAIKSNSGELGSLTDSQRQVLIDLAVMSWNEVVIELYNYCSMAHPNELGISSITLATNDRDYALPSNLVKMRWPLKNETTGDLIHEYKGGYVRMFMDQLQPNNYSGKPNYGCIRPSDGQLYLDMKPTSAENGAVYALIYDKALSVSVAADTFPFHDDVFNVLIGAVSEKMKEGTDEQSDARYAVSSSKYKKILSTAASLITMAQPQDSYYEPRFVQAFDPMDD